MLVYMSGYLGMYDTVVAWITVLGGPTCVASITIIPETELSDLYLLTYLGRLGILC